MYSSGEGDIFYFGQNVRANMRTQGFEGHQFYTALKKLFQQEREFHKAVKGLPSRLKLYEDIYITVRTLLAARKGAEEAEAFNAECSDSGAVLLKYAPDLLLHRALPLTGQLLFQEVISVDLFDLECCSWSNTNIEIYHVLCKLLAVNQHYLTTERLHKDLC